MTTILVLLLEMRRGAFSLIWIEGTALQHLFRRYVVAMLNNHGDVAGSLIVKLTAVCGTGKRGRPHGFFPF